MPKRKSGNVNSLSHALQVKKENDKENNKENNHNEKNDKKNKDGKNRMQKPNIIMKSKNHDKKINLHRLQKYK